MSSELEQIIARLDRAATLTEEAARKLAFNLEESKLLIEEDRVQIARLILLVRRLTEQGADTLEGTKRLESAASHVAEDLAARQNRADGAPSIPGAGADAALRSGETPHDG